MKVIIAPDSFKGSLTAREVCEAAVAGVAAIGSAVECVTVPMADGGEGTVQSLVDATGGSLRRATVTGPLGEPVVATYGILGDGRTAVIEMAAASGLPLVPEGQRDPLRTTTYGTGELIRAALDEGCRKLIIGLGGSATNDGGLGVAAALGARLLDDAGEPVCPTGAGLARLRRIDTTSMDPRLRETDGRVACDVDNPLYGPTGAAQVYGPQKGASPEAVRELDDGLRNFAAVVERDLGVAVADMPGAGAAGGLGAGLVAFCGARLERGVNIVIEAVELRQRMAGCHLCLTGEGRIDGQTVFGKTAKGVAEVARELGVPVVALGGAIEEDAPGLSECFDAVFCTCVRPMTLEQAMAPDTAKKLIGFTARQIVSLWIAREKPIASTGRS
ncbi:MAG: glycerate kinase [Armatimonadetes bacterium]|nr:glycerate kinase [Armatimonadota bacterium]